MDQFNKFEKSSLQAISPARPEQAEGRGALFAKRFKVASFSVEKLLNRLWQTGSVLEHIIENW